MHTLRPKNRQQMDNKTNGVHGNQEQGKGEEADQEEDGGMTLDLMQEQYGQEQHSIEMVFSGIGLHSTVGGHSLNSIDLSIATSQPEILPPKGWKNNGKPSKAKTDSHSFVTRLQKYSKYC